MKNNKIISIICALALMMSLLSGITASAAFVESAAPTTGKVWNLRDDFYSANSTGKTTVARTTFGGTIDVPYFTGSDQSAMVPFNDSYENSNVWNIGFNTANAIRYMDPTVATCNIDDNYGVAVTAFSTAKSHMAFITNNYSNPGYEDAIHGQATNGSEVYVYWTSPISGTINFSMILNRITDYRLNFSVSNGTTELITAQEFEKGVNTVGLSTNVNVGDKLTFTFNAPGASAVNSATASQFIINKFEISETKKWDFQRDMYEGIILPSKYAANSEYAKGTDLSVAAYDDAYGNDDVYSVEFVAENDEGTEVVLSPSGFVASGRGIAAMYPAAYKYEDRTASPYAYSYINTPVVADGTNVNNLTHPVIGVFHPEYSTGNAGYGLQIANTKENTVKLNWKAPETMNVAVTLDLHGKEGFAGYSSAVEIQHNGVAVASNALCLDQSENDTMKVCLHVEKDDVISLVANKVDDTNRVTKVNVDSFIIEEYPEDNMIVFAANNGYTSGATMISDNYNDRNFNVYVAYYAEDGRLIDVTMTKYDAIEEQTITNIMASGVAYDKELVSSIRAFVWDGTDLTPLIDSTDIDIE